MIPYMQRWERPDQFRRGPALFLDRDGVLGAPLAPHQYVWRWEEWEWAGTWMEGAVDAMVAGLLAWPGPVIVVTNQAGLMMAGGNWYDHYHDLNDHLHEVTKGAIDEVVTCPHEAAAGCECRKPAPGMLRYAAAELGADLRQAWLVGDNVGDLQAAEAVGARAVFVGLEEPRVNTLNVWWEADLPAALQLIRKICRQLEINSVDISV